MSGRPFGRLRSVRLFHDELTAFLQKAREQAQATFPGIESESIDDEDEGLTSRDYVAACLASIEEAAEYAHDAVGQLFAEASDRQPNRRDEFARIAFPNLDTSVPLPDSMGTGKPAAPTIAATDPGMEPDEADEDSDTDDDESDPWGDEDDDQ
jgi:hypothetical protein